MKILVNGEKELPIIRKANLEKVGIEKVKKRFYMDSKGQIFVRDDKGCCFIKDNNFS